MLNRKSRERKERNNSMIPFKVLKHAKNTVGCLWVQFLLQKHRNMQGNGKLPIHIENDYFWRERNTIQKREKYNCISQTE